jgi:opacity protein-like surface antigen
MQILATALKILALPALLTAAASVVAQTGDTNHTNTWYTGQNTGFWGLGDSVGVRQPLPGNFNPPGSNPESLSALRQYGGYRISSGFAIEGSQTQFRPNLSACNGDTGGGDKCSSSAWSLAGVATLPIQSGLSLHGRLGLQYRQKGLTEDGMHRSMDDPGNFARVYGIGLSYDLTKAITVHAETERYSDLSSSNGLSPNTGVGLDSSVHSIGLSIKF